MKAKVKSEEEIRNIIMEKYPYLLITSQTFDFCKKIIDVEDCNGYYGMVNPKDISEGMAIFKDDWLIFLTDEIQME